MANAVSVTRYTLEAWEKCYPGSPIESWDMRCIPDDIVAFAAIALNEIADSEVCKILPVEDAQTIKIVVLDEEYFEYIKRNNISNNEKARIDYAKAISKADATRLLKKNKLDVVYDLFAMQLIIVGGKDSTERIKLPNDIKNTIKKILQDRFGASVFIPGIITTPSMIADYDDEFFEKMKKGFVGAPMMPPDFTKYEADVHTCEGSVGVYSIPIMMKSKVPSAILTADDVFGDTMLEITHPDLCETNELSILEDMKIDLAENAIGQITPYLLSTDDVYDTYLQFVTLIKKEIDEKMPGGANG